jgi:hypothetical protein
MKSANKRNVNKGPSNIFKLLMNKQHCQHKMEINSIIYIVYNSRSACLLQIEVYLYAFKVIWSLFYFVFLALGMLRPHGLPCISHNHWETSDSYIYIDCRKMICIPDVRPSPSEFVDVWLNFLLIFCNSSILFLQLWHIFVAFVTLYNKLETFAQT